MPTYFNPETVLARGRSAGVFTKKQVDTIREFNVHMSHITIRWGNRSGMTKVPTNGFKLVGYSVHQKSGVHLLYKDETVVGGGFKNVSINEAWPYVTRLAEALKSPQNPPLPPPVNDDDYIPF